MEQLLQEDGKFLPIPLVIAGSCSEAYEPFFIVMHSRVPFLHKNTISSEETSAITYKVSKYFKLHFIA